jgi:hypothetical protein
VTDILTTLQPPEVIETTLQPPATITTTLAVGQGPAGPSGPAGATGPTGPAGPPGIDLHYMHDQMVPSLLWTVTHNMGKYPSVGVVDSGGSEVEGLVSHVSTNQLTIEFSAAFSGFAYLN